MKRTPIDGTRMPPKHPDYPDWLKAIFPMTFVYYKPTKPKPRKRHVGWKARKVVDQDGKGKLRWSKKMAAFQNSELSDQNNYSYVACCLLDPNGWGTVRRSLKHKGYSKLCAAVYSADWEIAQARRSWRYVFHKYKTMEQFYELREVVNPELEDLCKRVSKQFPSRVDRQLRLF